MNCCYISLGSNQKAPERQIRTALKKLRELPGTDLIKCSSLHWTKAWGVANQQDFCNAVVKIRTRLQPHSLLAYCQKIEKMHGRIRKKRWGPRTLDIDIILYEQRTVNTTDLIVPHPHYLQRDFVLMPLLELDI